jgi:signal transduction histidine kinase
MVLVAGAATTWLVASAVGPGVFHQHLRSTDIHHTAAETTHVERAFNASLLMSISIALLVAVLTALAVSWYLSHRVQRSIGEVEAAASEIAAGRYGTRVRDPGLGPEFAALATSYNTLAARLETAEGTRRRMLADLAHEMRTPLATIDAHLEAVDDGVRELDHDTLKVIRSSTERLRRLAEDVGAVSRAEDGDLDLDLRLVTVRDLVSAAAEAARDRFTANAVDLRTVLDAGNDEVRVDCDRIGQVMANLLDNALRHTPAGGVVTLSCHRSGKSVELVVSDTGEGVTADHLRHLFDRFYRVDTARDRGRGGSGIGLSIAKALVEAHGGTITATSAGSGQGATFAIRLPRIG